MGIDVCDVVIPTCDVGDVVRTPNADLAAIWSWHVIGALSLAAGYGHWLDYQALATQVLLAEAASHLRCSLSFASYQLRRWCGDHSIFEGSGVEASYGS